ncbi:4-(cytidine 5'-diphospho)-2-C-methyl-D-erythritol kinase [Anaerococcus sp. AGMB09787]|uniref:4-(cytidine 5'-diphospho)-2-C-methyl-D-erythritol kinase n=1 Tax=Anaerococcus sp. AGMB09787 TaxID=2922869 RepID=UPI001FAFE144|nr:4-(cytidine 5'-diphospho)-2-C-methyl-D-erythritol kinase [Anaerococcus sp. AGMB09787]
MEKNCYAKINLTLDSLYKRNDGYHEIDSIMVRIGLFDKLIINKNENGTFNFKSNVDLGDLEDNLIYKAYALLKDRVDDQGLDVELVKNIPVAAGLAGGSTDAAEMIKALNDLWELGLSKGEMIKLGASLGADIPFFFLEKAARARGIGEILSPFTNKVNIKILLINDGTEISSAFVYNRLKDYGVIDNEKIIEGLKAGDPYVVKDFRNVMEDVIFENYPHLKEIRDILLDKGAANALVSGSGASIFGVFLDDDFYQRAYEDLKTSYKFCEKVDLIDD